MSETNKIQTAQILANQSKTAAMINSLIELSSNTLLCGPDCQKAKTAKELEQKYYTAQAEIKTAPVNLENAEKNYYVFTEGENVYNERLEKKLKQEAEKLGNLIIENFNKEIEQAKILNLYLNSDIINSSNTMELYKDYLEKNKKTEKKIKFSQGDILTNDRKTYYETQEKDNLKGWYNIFLAVYYLLAIGYFTTIFSNPALGNLFKIITFILLLIIPFIINPITIFILTVLKKVFDLLPKNVYYSNENENDNEIRNEKIEYNTT